MSQAYNTAVQCSDDPAVVRAILDEALRRYVGCPLDLTPGEHSQVAFETCRELTGVEDPYLEAKREANAAAMALYPSLRERLTASADPLRDALLLAVAGNIIDMGIAQEYDLIEDIVKQVERGFDLGDLDGFRAAQAEAKTILYLGDNAGEIVFDRLLIEQLSPARVTLAVRGAPVINDATLVDARAVGLHEIVEIIDNGSDAPGTILEDCSQDFIRRFTEADLILAKGQGNFETLSDDPRDIFFLFKAKCPVIAACVGLPIGTHVLARSNARLSNPGDCAHARI